MRRVPRLFGSSLLVLLTAGFASGQTPYPEITHALPNAVQRGTTSEITVLSNQPARAFAGASQVFFEGEGISAVALPREAKAPADRVKLKVTVAPTASVGMREFRIATGHGISSLGELLVVDDPVVTEKPEGHDTPDKAQAIGIGQVVCGAINAREQVDLYKFTAKAGQGVTFAVTSHRFCFKRHNQIEHVDPILVLSDSTGHEIASNDDYYSGDPMLHHRFETPGDYYVAVRDVNYNGASFFNYSLLLSDRPYVTSVFPMAIAPTGPRTFAATGFLLQNGPLPLRDMPGPAPLDLGPHSVQLTSGGVATNPVTVEVANLPIQGEVEPNDAQKQANQAPTVRVVLNGRMDQTNDVDSYAFALKAGRPVRFEVTARRNGSSLDSNLRLLTEKGDSVAANDDSPGSKDSLLIYTPPADGLYTLQIRDLLNRGGPTFGYFIRAGYEEPDFDMTCDDDKAGIGPDGAVPWFVRATRRAGFNGPIEVRVEGLPPGVTVNPLTIPPSMTDGCLILQAARNAKPAASSVRVIAKATVNGMDGKPHEIERRVQPLQELYMGGGGRNVWPVQTQVVQIIPDYDIAAVKVTPLTLSLRPGEQTTLEVEVARRPNYKGRVTLDLQLQHLGTIFGNPVPPGVKFVEAGSKTSLAPDESKGRIILKADPDAKPLDKVPIAVVAYISIDFVVKRAYSSPPVWVTVGPPLNAIAAKK
jgi:hypothetical protein